MCTLDILDLGPVPPCPRVALGGISQVYVGSRRNYRFVHQATGDKQVGRILIYQRADENIEQLIPILPGATMVEVKSDLPSNQHTTTLQFGLALPDADARDWLERLRRIGDAIFFVLDGNNQAWVMGESNGCSVRYTRVSEEPNRYEVTARCRAAYPCRILIDHDCMGSPPGINIAGNTPETAFLVDDNTPAEVSYPYAVTCCISQEFELSELPDTLALDDMQDTGSSINFEFSKAEYTEYDELVELQVTASGCGVEKVVPLWLNIKETPFAFNKAVQLDGVNDYYLATNHADLNFGAGDFSISCWYKRGVSAPTGYGLILNKTTGSPTIGFRLMWEYHTRRIQMALVEAGVGTTVSTPLETVPLSSWIHIVVTRETGTVRIYINGVLIISPVVAAQNIDNTGPLLIGTDNLPIWGPLNGTVDEVQLYKGYALTPAQAAWLYNAGNGNKPPQDARPHLSARYTFDQLATAAYPNPTIADQSGNGHTLTGYNIASDPLVNH